MAMDPATLVREARERHGLSQARLAHRARTTQASISRIERGEEDVTWGRLRGLLHAVGEEPALTSEPMEYDGEPFRVLDAREAPMELLLPAVLASNKNVAEFRMHVAEGQRKQGGPVTVYKPERFEPHHMLETLAEFGVEYVLVGGVAVQAYGSPRLTDDVDLIPRPDLINYARLAEALTELEAVWRKVRSPLPLTDPHRLARADQLVLVTRFGDLDVLKAEQVYGGSYEELRRNATSVSFGGLTVLVAGVDDLIRMKRAAGRWQDLRDIATLTHPSEDLQRATDEFYNRLRAQLEGDEPT
jgi:transcriptional regulator with XRE-family HTH domain